VPDDEQLLARLVEDELRLLDPAVRASREEVERLLHPDFVEVGASGTVYDRAAILAALAADPGPGHTATDVAAQVVAPGAALVTYAVAGTRRSSLWVRTDAGWRVLYHQGTPAAG